MSDPTRDPDYDPARDPLASTGSPRASHTPMTKIVALVLAFALVAGMGAVLFSIIAEL